MAKRFYDLPGPDSKFKADASALVALQYDGDVSVILTFTGWIRGFSFDTSAEALAFVDLWVERAENL